MTNLEIAGLLAHQEGVFLYRQGKRLPHEYADTYLDVCRNQGWLAAQQTKVLQKPPQP